MKTCNRLVKFGLKIPNHFGKNIKKFQGGGDFVTHCSAVTMADKQYENLHDSSDECRLHGAAKKQPNT